MSKTISTSLSEKLGNHLWWLFFLHSSHSMVTNSYSATSKFSPEFISCIQSPLQLPYSRPSFISCVEYCKSLLINFKKMKLIFILISPICLDHWSIFFTFLMETSLEMAHLIMSYPSLLLKLLSDLINFRMKSISLAKHTKPFTLVPSKNPLNVISHYSLPLTPLFPPSSYRTSSVFQDNSGL